MTSKSGHSSSFYISSGGSRSQQQQPRSKAEQVKRRNDSMAMEYDENEDEQTAQTNSVVQELLKQWESQYCSYREINTFVGTFNLNGKAPTQSLRPWLAVGIDQPPDLYAIGFQELDLNTTAYIVDNPKREMEWREATKNGLHPGAKYEIIACHKLIGIYLLLAVRTDARVQISDVTVHDIPTGFMSVLGNKGGVGISIKVNDTRLCFVCSHLAAHLDEVDRRNQDFRDICSKLRFGQMGQLSVFDHDALIWLGDLNYRLDNLSTSDAKKFTAAREFDLMLEHDQLKAVQRRRHAFHEFFEAPILFAPTYKYDPGTDNLDSSEKQRPPAWTDRILYFASGTSIATTSYEGVMSIRTSDHKPVRCIMNIKVKTIDAAKQARFHSQALAELDRRANELLPQLTLDQHERHKYHRKKIGGRLFKIATYHLPDFDFGVVKFMQPMVLSLTCRNTGKSMAEYRFRVPPDRKTICKSWLQITPEHRKIASGEDCTIDLQVLVDKATAWQMTGESSVLEDMLVLHLRAGRDYFIALRATYTPSVFGQSLQAVVDKQQRMAREAPLISIPTQDSTQSGTLQEESTSHEGPSEPIPRPLWLLVEEVMAKHIDDPDIFHVTGSASDFALVRDFLDDGGHGEFPALQCGVHSLVEAIERYLDCLPDAVIPARYTNTFLAAAPNPYTCQQTLKLLPPDNRATFDYLIKFMSCVLAKSSINKWNMFDFAKLWAPFLFRLDGHTASSDTSSRSSARSVDTAARFVMQCLSQWQTSNNSNDNNNGKPPHSASNISLGQDALNYLAAPAPGIARSGNASSSSIASQPSEWVTFDQS